MDVNDRRKIVRLVQWCDDVNQLQQKYRYEPLSVSWDDRINHGSRARRFQEIIDIYGVQTRAL